MELLVHSDPKLDLTIEQSNLLLVSDSTMREQGRSHGAIVFQNGINLKRHILFANLEPQPNGACFVVFSKIVNWQIAGKDKISIRAINLSNKNSLYNVVINTKKSINEKYSFQAEFRPEGFENDHVISIEKFRPYRRGIAVESKETITEIETIGIQIKGRVEGEFEKNQQGVFALGIYKIELC